MIEKDIGVMVYKIMPGSRLRLTCIGMGNLRVVKYESDCTFDPSETSDPNEESSLLFTPALQTPLRAPQKR